MLYETLWLTLAASYLWFRRKQSASLMGEFLILNGIGRTVIEHWRLNERVALGLSEAQFIGMGLVVFGVILIVRARAARGEGGVQTELHLAAAEVVSHYP